MLLYQVTESRYFDFAVASYFLIFHFKIHWCLCCVFKVNLEDSLYSNYNLYANSKNVIKYTCRAVLSKLTVYYILASCTFFSGKFHSLPAVLLMPINSQSD